MRRWRERIGALLLFAVCVWTLGISASASGHEKVVDGAGLLAQEEQEDLEQRLVQIAEEYSCDVAVVTTVSCGGLSVQEYTDRYYYEHAYGYGAGSDGIMLLVSIGDRRFHLATRGYGAEAFTDYGLEVIDEKITPYLSDGKYARAFQKFADLAEEFLEEAAGGAPYDVRHTYQGERSIWPRLLISVGIGLAAAIAALAALAGQLRSVRAGVQAQDYVRGGSFRITRANDLFLYRTVSRRRIERGQSGGGGGSTMHSAPGGSAGGRSGSF